jgi:hypothetical protein
MNQEIKVYKVGDKLLIAKDGILCKAESKFGKEPWTITTVHTNGTIRVQCGTKSERINIRRVTPYTDKLVLEDSYYFFLVIGFSR